MIVSERPAITAAVMLRTPTVTTTASHVSAPRVAKVDGIAAPEYMARSAPPIAATNAPSPEATSLAWTTLRPIMRDPASLVRVALSARPTVERRRLRMPRPTIAMTRTHR